MLKKTITFEDYNGKQLTEDFYFNLSKAEIAEMELSQDGGLTEYLQKIVSENDGAKLVAMFKELLTKSVGRRSEDGRNFIKNQKIVDDFIQSNAYSELFVELATNADQASAFVRGIVPASMSAAIPADITNVELPAASDAAQASPKSVQEQIEEKFKDESWVPNQQELLAMSQDQLQRAYVRKNSPAAPPVPSA